MLSDTKHLPDDPDLLKGLIASLTSELTNRDLVIARLEHQLAGLRRHQFGSRSESLDQLELSLEEEEIARAAEAPGQVASDAAGERQQPKRRPLPEQLPRRETLLTPGGTCLDCGGKLRELGRDVTEELEYLPGRYVVNRYVRPRLACSCCERIIQARLPSRPIERGRPGSGLLAHVLVGKYADHLPLYRQSQIFERDGIDLPRSTLTGWVGQMTGLLEPLAEAIGKHVRRGQAIFAASRGPWPRAGPRKPREGAGEDAGTRHRQDRHGAALDLCAGRAALVRRSGAGGLVPVQHRPQG